MRALPTFRFVCGYLSSRASVFGCLLVSYWPLVLREHRITRGFIYECRESAPKYKYDGAKGYVHGRVLRGRVVDARSV